MKTGAMIRMARQRAGLTQQELAKKIGRGASNTISQYENGLRQVAADQLPIFAQALGCRVADLVEEPQQSEP